jgi:uncharacterized protein (UPF0332 family)
MTPEVAAYLDKARQCLSNSRALQAIGLNNDAGRNAYFAAFHSAQALIFSRTGRVAKTHSGVRSEFARLAKAEPAIDRSLTGFLASAYALKEVADYETGPDAMIPHERASAALESAEQFVDRVAGLLDEGQGAE